MEALERIGLRGPYQVHVAPVVLVPDERAHQVFLGFPPAVVASALAERYPGSAPAWLDGAAGPVPLAALAEREEGEATVVVAALRHDHPGGLYGLVHIVDRLLGPGGCPWDQEQTHQSLLKHLVEEAYELAEAVESGDEEAIREEVGDVLLQPLMHAQMDRRDGKPGVDAVAAGVCAKLVRRHPHVFGGLEAADSGEVLKNWDRIKAGEGRGRKGLGGVPRAMPALMRAQELGKRAARAGFDWPGPEGVWEKLAEELEELREAWGTDSARDELGDVLFTAVNLARWAAVEAEDALRSQLDRFELRYAAMERLAGDGLEGLPPDELEALWQRAKAEAG